MKHNGRGIDHHWNVRKYTGDAAYYARCRCGYYYCCGDSLFRKNYVDWTLYNYCPSCGAHKKWLNPKPQLIDRDLPEGVE